MDLTEHSPRDSNRDFTVCSLYTMWTPPLHSFVMSLKFQKELEDLVPWFIWRYLIWCGAMAYAGAVACNFSIICASFLNDTLLEFNIIFQSSINFPIFCGGMLRVRLLLSTITQDKDYSWYVLQIMDCKNVSLVVIRVQPSAGSYLQYDVWKIKYLANFGEVEIA